MELSLADESISAKVKRIEEYLGVFELDKLDEAEVRAITEAGKKKDFRKWTWSD